VRAQRGHDAATTTPTLERQSQNLFQPACFDWDFSPKI
jgi:hypothetical protein